MCIIDKFEFEKEKWFNKQIKEIGMKYGQQFIKKLESNTPLYTLVIIGKKTKEWPGANS